MTFLPFPEWLPDQPDYNNPGSSNIQNAIPLTSQSYGPTSAFSAFTTTGLNLRCQGASNAIDSSAAVNLFAADQKDLYLLQTGAAWSVVSKSTHPYNCAATDFWGSAQFGQNIYFANINDPMQVMALSGSTFADLGGGSPKAKYLTIIRDFLVASWTNDGSNNNPQRVWWSAINNPASWPTPGTAGALQVQSDYQDIAGTQGWLQGVVANLGYVDAAVFFERAVFRMQYVGAPAIFQFTAAEGVRGTPAPYSLTQYGATVYYLGEDGFYAFDGANSIPIGAQKVDKWFFGRVDQNNLQRIQGAVDPLNKVVTWAFPDAGAASGNPNNLLCFKTDLNRWFWVPGCGNLEFITRMLSVGYTLEGLSAVYPVLETVPAPLDSRVWTGGKVVLGAFNTSHNLGYFTGSSLAATLETSEQQINPDGRIHVRNTRPIVANTAAQTVTIGHRERIADSVVYSAASALNLNGTAPIDCSGRYIRGQMQIPAGILWTHAEGLEIEAVPAGQR